MAHPVQPTLCFVSGEKCLKSSLFPKIAEQGRRQSDGDATVIPSLDLRGPRRGQAFSLGSLFGSRLMTGPQFPCEHSGSLLTARGLAANSKVNFCTRRCLFWKRRDPLLLRSDSSSIIKSWGTLSFLPRSSKGTAGEDRESSYYQTFRVLRLLTRRGPLHSTIHYVQECQFLPVLADTGCHSVDSLPSQWAEMTPLSGIACV